MALPAVPDPGALDPLIENWPAGKQLVRVYDGRWSSTGFNPTSSSGRFRPISDSTGATIPTLYGASDGETALAEGLLRGVSALKAGARRRLYAPQIEGHELVVLECARDLRLVRLHGSGLQRLGLLREHVIDTNEDRFPYTAEWARALWGCRARPHGVIWTSRHNDSARALMLWEGRVDIAWLRTLTAPLALDRGGGLNLVREACLNAGVDLEA